MKNLIDSIPYIVAVIFAGVGGGFGFMISGEYTSHFFVQKVIEVIFAIVAGTAGFYIANWFGREILKDNK